MSVSGGGDAAIADVPDIGGRSKVEHGTLWVMLKSALHVGCKGQIGRCRGPGDGRRAGSRSGHCRRRPRGHGGGADRGHRRPRRRSCARSPTRSAAPARPRPARCGSRAITRARRQALPTAPRQAESILLRSPARRSTASCATAYLRSGPEAIDYLEAHSDVQFLPCGKHPDYRSNMPGAALAGRAIMPKPFDGRLLGADFKRVRPPHPGVHGVRRHDGRQGRHRAADRPLPLAARISSTRRNCLRATSSTGCATRAAPAS